MKKTRILMNVILAWLLGIALTMMIKSICMIHDIQANTVFVAELSDNILPGRRIVAESLISDFPNVNKSSVELISAQRAHQTMIKEMPEIEYMSSNPFRDIILFKTINLSHENVASLVDELRNIQGIEDIYYDEELLAAIPHSIRRIKLGLLITSIFLLIGALGALVLRIKRDLRAHQENIKIMSLAGSEEELIIGSRRNWSIKWGSITAGIAAVFAMINILFVNQTLLYDLEITFLQSLTAIILMMLVVISLHALTTHFTIKSYLSQLNPNITS